MGSNDYIEKNFLTLEDLSEATSVSAVEIGNMINSACLPGPAYEIDIVSKIRSVFGEHEQSSTRAYFPKSHIEKIKAFLAAGVSYETSAAKEQKNFQLTYAKKIEESGADKFGLANFFQADGTVGGEPLEIFLQAEWQHYLDGTYGLCTRNATADEIACKEVMIAKIKYLTKQYDQEHEPALLAPLAEAVDVLDAVSAPFAPHEIARSSRGLYIDAVRKKYLA